MPTDSKKSELRVAIDADFLKKLEERLGLSKSTDIARAAFTLLDWASEEVQEGRMILSTNREGKDTHRLVMPELSNVKHS